MPRFPMFVAVLWLCALPGAAAAELFAAIAFSGTTGMAGTAWNFETATLAETEAYQNCGAEDCETLVVFSQCGALAVGDGYAYGFGYDLSLNTATDTALANCAGFSSNCQITAAFCNEGF